MLSSIKAKVIVFYICIFSVSLSVLGIILYYTLNKIIIKTVDDALISKAQALATLIENEHDEINFVFSDEIMWEYSSVKSINYFQIRKQDGSTIEKSKSLANFDLPFYGGVDKTTFDTFYLNDKPLRIVNLFFKKNGTPVIVQCAQNIEKELELLENFKIALTILITGLILISTAGGFLIIRKTLSPIKIFSDTVQRISEKNLSERINVKNLPDELKTLAESFNKTLEKLEMAFRIQKQFIGDAAHELRTPLSVIMTQCEVILRKKRQIEDYENTLITIKNVVETMASMVKKLLTLARLTEDEIQLKKEEVMLNEILYNASNLLHSLARRKNVTINLHVKNAFKILGDKTLLTELFINLIENAIKYNKADGKVDIFMEKNDDEFIKVIIKDTGIGIPQEEIDKVFEKFYKVDKSRCTEEGSTGLGLSICKEIIKWHKGKITMTSKIGEGTIVTVYLPVK